VSIGIVEVPAMAGDPSHGAAAGPAALTAALSGRGLRPPVRRVRVPPFAGDVRAASSEVVVRTAREVRAVVRQGARPLVLAGSCDVAPGVVAAIGDPGMGVVWIDAHADFNTPDSSVSGFWPGMSLAVLTGDCGESVWSALGRRPVPAARVALLGVRDLSPAAEAERVAASGMHVVGWRSGRPRRPVPAVLDRLDADRVYVHLDLDALDPLLGAGVVDPPVPGGLSAEQLTELLGLVRERFDLAGATIATYVPGRDDGRTLAAATTAIERLLA
jgi:arginase